MIMMNVFKFQRFRKNSIFLCFFLIVISLIDYFNQYIPSTIDQIIKKDIFLFVIFFVWCFVLDVIKEIYNKKNKEK